jgi:mannosyltransferase OCH1-like enzyme
MLESIPKIIHQIWLGPLKSPKEAMDSWVQNHPDWTYCLWTEDNLPVMVNYQAFLESDNYPQKADILRYELLYQFGGIYIDADVHCLKSIDTLYADWLEGGQYFVAANEGNKDNPDLMANTFIASSKGHPFLKSVIKGVDINKEGGAWEITGPKYFTEAIYNFKPVIKILPSKIFFPIHHGDKDQREINLEELKVDNQIYGVHLWSGTKRAYEPVWYKHPWKYLFLQIRKSLNKTFQIKS